jgi:hypothetical protein
MSACEQMVGCVVLIVVVVVDGLFTSQLSDVPMLEMA